MKSRRVKAPVLQAEDVHTVIIACGIYEGQTVLESGPVTVTTLSCKDGECWMELSAGRDEEAFRESVYNYSHFEVTFFVDRRYILRGVGELQQMDFNRGDTSVIRLHLQGDAFWPEIQPR